MKKLCVYLTFLIVLLYSANLNAQITATSFATNVDFTTGTTPARLASADLNADGKMDVVVPNNGASTLTVLRNTSTSTGVGASSLTFNSTITANATLQGVVLADFDGDGKPDLITTHGNIGGGGGGTNNIYVYQNGSSTGGTIGFFTGTAFAVGINPVSATAADIDGDGKLDLVVGCAGNGLTNTGSIVVMRNTSTGAGVFTFVASSAYAANINTPYAVKVADFDSDGKLDIVASNYIAAGYVSVYKNASTSGSITLTPVNTYTAGTQPGFLDVGDIDGDGKMDIVVSNYGSANASIFRNTTTSTISFAAAVNFTTGTNPSGCSLTDFDGDGKLDLALVNRTSGTLAFYKNTSTIGTISSAPVVTYATNNSPTGLITADIDGDLKSEVLITNAGVTNMSVFRNKIIATEPTVASSALSFSGIQANSVTLNFTKGNGAKRIILAKAASAVSNDPTDSFAYSANALFGSGAQIGSGNYVVYNDTGSSVTVNNLTTGTNYYFTVYEYNGSAAYTNYLTSSTLTGNQIVSGNVFYSNASGPLNLTSSWGTNTNGTGTAPANFTTPGSFYFVQNNSSPTINANWAVSGTSSLIVFGDGTNAFNFIIPSGLTVTCDTISVKANVTLTIQGTLSINKSFFDNTVTAQYLGTSAQNVAPGNYYNLVFMSGAKTLMGNVSVRNILNMSTNVNTSSYSLTLGSASGAGTLSRSNGSIIGSFSRWFNNTTNLGTTGLFPMGTTSYYRPIQIEYTIAPTVGGLLTASYYNSNPGGLGLPIFDFTNAVSEFIDKQSPDGYWNISASGLTGGTYTSTATGTGVIGVTSYTDLRMIKRANASSAWTISGTANSGTGSNLAPIVSRTGLTGNNSEFGIGSDQLINSLPVKLIILSVYQSNNNAVLTWQTASEIKSDYFGIERSINNVDWTSIAKVQAQGNSNVQVSYGYKDDIKPLMQQNVKTIYYKLKQVDIDGAAVYSNTITVNLKPGVNNITLYPLPLNNILTAISNNGELVSEISLLDMSGKEILTSSVGQLDVSNVAAGIYLAKVTTDKQVYYQKITK